jgi:hypothetical protein
VILVLARRILSIYKNKIHLCPDPQEVKVELPKNLKPVEKLKKKLRILIWINL